ncbi:MAG: HNH endonuclease [Bacteroidales bacterium]|jgi:hypothetical protein
MITQEYLKEHFNYNPETGEFLRKKNKIVKTIGKREYRKINIDGKFYKAHRLIWLYTYGTWPDDFIDHIDGDKHNNRIDNLRNATNSENQCNRTHPKNNKFNIKGFYIKRNGNITYYTGTVSFEGKKYTKYINTEKASLEEATHIIKSWLIQKRKELHKDFRRD